MALWNDDEVREEQQLDAVLTLEKKLKKMTNLCHSFEDEINEYREVLKQISSDGHMIQGLQFDELENLASEMSKKAQDVLEKKRG